MAVEELLPSNRPLGPLVRALNEHGCTLTLLPGPTLRGVVKVRLLYPENEYLEKRCRRILADWLASTGSRARSGHATTLDRRTRSGTRLRSLT